MVLGHAAFVYSPAVTNRTIRLIAWSELRVMCLLGVICNSRIARSLFELLCLARVLVSLCRRGTCICIKHITLL